MRWKRLFIGDPGRRIRIIRNGRLDAVNVGTRVPQRDLAFELALITGLTPGDTAFFASTVNPCAAIPLAIAVLEHASL